MSQLTKIKQYVTKIPNHAQKEYPVECYKGSITHPSVILCMGLTKEETMTENYSSSNCYLRPAFEYVHYHICSIKKQNSSAILEA